MADQSRLHDVASAVADGSAVDWDSADESIEDAADKAILGELRVLARMTGALRSQLAPRAAAPHVPGTQLKAGDLWGHLRIIEVLGEGSFGTVYRAWDTRLECEVALKLVKESGISPAFDLSRALKEARLLARVHHRNVVRVHGADSHSGRFGLWMELISGRSLQQVLALHGPMGMNEAIPIAIDICHALAAVHRAGLLHCDIKAHNVLREEGGRIVVMDFGTGHCVDHKSDTADSLAGTPLYLAPELFFGAKPSISSDIYSLGILVYYLVTGDYPIRGKVFADVEAMHVTGGRHALRDVRPDLPSAFIDAVERALCPNPADRYRSAGEFGNALAAISGSKYLPDPATPRSAWKLTFAAAALLVAAVAVGFNLFDRQDSVPRSTSSILIPDSGRVTGSTPGTGAAVSADTSYDVTAAFYASRDGRDVRLTHGSRLRPGDKLFAVVDASTPVFVYIINRDEAGHSFLLFPLPEFNTANPISPNQAGRLPGMKNGEQHYWEVTSAGGREHFSLYITPQRLVEFEHLLNALPKAELGRTVSSMPLSASAVGVLRGVGGLTAGAAPANVTIDPLGELQPLSDHHERAEGLWARRVTFDNPAE